MGVNLYSVPSGAVIAHSADGKTYYRDSKLWAHRVGNYLHDAGTNQVFAYRIGIYWYRENSAEVIYQERLYPHE